jgi:hypothetical protein
MNQNDELVTDLATAASSSSSAEPEVVQWQRNQLLGNADALEPAHPNSSASATPSSSALDELRVLAERMAAFYRWSRARREGRLWLARRLGALQTRFAPVLDPPVRADTPAAALLAAVLPPPV